MGLMDVLQRVRGGSGSPYPNRESPRPNGSPEEARVAVLERIAELELALEDQGWRRLSIETDHEFSRDGLTKVIRLSRAMYLSNPLINHAVQVCADYIWGQGITVVARDAGINGVIQRFFDDRRNLVELTGHEARVAKEVELETSGNLFLVLFTNPSTGAVRVRSIDVDEVRSIISNPEDAKEPWYYLREWSQAELPSGVMQTGATKRMVAYYPDWNYRPRVRPSSIGDYPVQWDAPVMHIRVGGLPTMRFGVPEVYQALAWARSVKEDLEDYATIRRAQSKFAWRLNTLGGKNAVAAAKTRLGSTVGLATSAGETNPPPIAGSTFIQGEGANLEPIKTAGMTPSPDEARRLWLMVSAGTGIPETMLSGDATVGNYATAKSLDRPTELKMRSRQELWAGVLTDLCNYVIDAAATAKNGPLIGREVTDPYTGDTTVEVIDGLSGEPTDRRIDVDFPDLLERDVLPRVQAIVSALTLNGQNPAGLIDREAASRLLMVALGMDDVDEALDQLYPDAPPLDPGAVQPLPDAAPPDPDGLLGQPAQPTPTPDPMPPLPPMAQF